MAQNLGAEGDGTMAPQTLGTVSNDGDRPEQLPELMEAPQTLGASSSSEGDRHVQSSNPLETATVLRTLTPSLPSASAAHEPVRDFTMVRRAAMSRWRWPQAPGELPLYVQRNFRLKTFGLIGCQLLVVFGLTVMVDTFLSTQFVTPHAQFMFYILGLFAMGGILSLHFARDSYPLNYLLLLVVTLLVGVFWGTTRLAFDTWLHFQVIGVLCITTFVAAVASAIMTTQKMEPWSLLFASLLPGWVISTVADFIIVSLLPAHLGISLASALVATSLAFLLMMAVLILDVGVLLVKCNPDDFMRVIISMDSALLVVVSMPIFILSCCLLHTVDMQEQAAEAPPEDEERRGQAPAQDRVPA